MAAWQLTHLSYLIIYHLTSFILLHTYRLDLYSLLLSPKQTHTLTLMYLVLYRRSIHRQIQNSLSNSFIPQYFFMILSPDIIQPHLSFISLFIFRVLILMLTFPSTSLQYYQLYTLTEFFFISSSIKLSYTISI